MTRFFILDKRPNYHNKPRPFKELTKKEYIQMGGSKDTVWLTVDVIHATDKAYKVSDSKTEIWIPKSQIIDSEDDIVVGKTAVIELPLWLAEKEGLT